METSILNSVKKILGLAPEYTAFDDDVITHINAVFSTLTQLGIGPATGFSIASDESDWGDFLEDGPILGFVKTYIYLRVRLIFDPPASSYVLASLEKQIQEFEWRLNVMREGSDWSDPTPLIVEDETVLEAIDGGIIQ